MKVPFNGQQPQFWVGVPVWPSQEWANKSGEIEPGIVYAVHGGAGEYSYDVVYQDGYINYDIPERDLSSLKPKAPNPNEILKKLI
ncbi:MAG TPA: hypothetical protein VK590_03190 [Saprospiraceae bacterium]|nr:hypothetical protein [Saprospiraceae bacterium]